MLDAQSQKKARNSLLVRFKEASPEFYITLKKRLHQQPLFDLSHSFDSSFF